MINFLFYSYWSDDGYKHRHVHKKDIKLTDSVFDLDSLLHTVMYNSRPPDEEHEYHVNNHNVYMGRYLERYSGCLEEYFILHISDIQGLDDILKTCRRALTKSTADYYDPWWIEEIEEYVDNMYFKLLFLAHRDHPEFNKIPIELVHVIYDHYLDISDNSDD